MITIKTRAATAQAIKTANANSRGKGFHHTIADEKPAEAMMPKRLHAAVGDMLAPEGGLSRAR